MIFKLILSIIWFLLLFNSNVVAYEENYDINKQKHLLDSGHKDEFTEDIKVLIKQLKKAPPEKRYEYMNKIKLKLRKINSQERLKIIKKLREELSKEHRYIQNKHEPKMKKHQKHILNYRIFNRNDEMQKRFEGRRDLHEHHSEGDRNHDIMNQPENRGGRDLYERRPDIDRNHDIMNQPRDRNKSYDDKNMYRSR